MTDLAFYMTELGKAAKQAASTLRLAPETQRNAALMAMAKHIKMQQGAILSANKKDMVAAQAKGLSDAMLDRLKLDPKRIGGIAKGLEDIASLPDPVGAIDKNWTQPNGLEFEKIRVPIGVIGMIYESRPNVTADAGGLCVKSGNACVLRGGSESAHSSTAIHAALQAGLKEADIPEAAISLVNTTDRAAVGEMLRGLDGSIDIIIPRGGKGLVARVQERTGVCGSTETCLIDKNIAERALPALKSRIGDRCEFRGDPTAREIIPDMKLANDTDFATEHLAAILNIAIVDGLEDALNHIARFGSGHTDAILTNNEAVARSFLNSVDSAIVLHNASTQYADGGEFGFGAEIGIATGRLHARGPVGAEHLTTYKYQVRGTGQVRP